MTLKIGLLLQPHLHFSFPHLSSSSLYSSLKKHIIIHYYQTNPVEFNWTIQVHLGIYWKIANWKYVLQNTRKLNTVSVYTHTHTHTFSLRFSQEAISPILCTFDMKYRDDWVDFSWFNYYNNLIYNTVYFNTLYAELSLVNKHVLIKLTDFNYYQTSWNDWPDPLGRWPSVHEYQIYLYIYSPFCKCEPLKKYKRRHNKDWFGIKLLNHLWL